MDRDGGTVDRREDVHGEIPSNVGVDEIRTTTDCSTASSQLIAGPACSTTGGGVRGDRGWGASHGGESADLSINTDVFSNDGSYFLLDEGGRHVLDDQGSPARAKNWQPSNTHQREQYM